MYTKLFVLVLVSVVAFAIVANAADRGQYVVAVKTDNLSLGSGLDYSAKFVHFATSGCKQYCMQPINLKYNALTLYGGWLTGWSAEAVGYGGLKFAPDLSSHVSLTVEHTLINNRGVQDFYHWSAVEYNTVFRGAKLYLGPHLELVQSGGLTKAWAGLHIGAPNLVEVGLYYRSQEDWQLRGAFTLMLHWPK